MRYSVTFWLHPSNAALEGSQVLKWLNVKGYKKSKSCSLNLRWIVDKSSWVRPLITAGESTGVSSGTNWLTPGTEMKC